MSVRQARYSQEEFARRGQEIYDRDVWSKLGPDDEGKFVAIDIESASYEIHQNDFSATERLLRHHPDAQIWLARVGQRATYRLGNMLTTGSRLDNWDR